MPQNVKQSGTGDLTLEHIVKTFRGRNGGENVHVVDDVSLTIPSGEFVTLLGPSGCGKTTTLRLIEGGTHALRDLREGQTVEITFEDAAVHLLPQA